MSVTHKFLKFEGFDKQVKHYNSDGMNGYGKNVKRQPPDMLEYWNFYLTNDMYTTNRQKYTWLDNFAFIGGNIDFILIGLGIAFSTYNYKIENYKLYYKHHKSKMMQIGKENNFMTKAIQKNLLCLGPILLLMDLKNFTKRLLSPCI